MQFITKLKQLNNFYLSKQSLTCADYSPAAPAPSGYDNSAPTADYGNNAQEAVPYAAGDNLNNLVSTSVTYPQNKSRVLIYQPAAMVIKRKPTQLILRHPPTYVQPAPLIVHQPPPLIAKKVYVQNYPQSVKVTPLYVNVVKPNESKYYLKPKAPASPKGPADYSSNSYAPADYSSNSYAPADYSSNSYAPADYSSNSYAPAGYLAPSPSYGPADYSSNSYAPADYSSNNLPADYHSTSYTAPAGDAYSPSDDYSGSPAYSPSSGYSADNAAPSIDASGSPAYAFANQDSAAARAGFKVIQDGNAANALINLSSTNYQPAQSAY